MVQTFSIHSEELATFLGTAFLNTERITILSPWVSDITVRFPVCDRLSTRELLLSESIRRFDVDVTVIVSPDASDHNWEKRYSLLPKIEDAVDIHSVENLHAKAIITDSLLYLGSANITYNGLNKNIELCQLMDNIQADTAGFLAERLDIHI
jgi:phosphatidylserine/phosphatidylglycerophosphate/cardiolipin synthase-like enzyme